jgi:hypothetical protein
VRLLSRIIAGAGSGSDVVGRRESAETSDCWHNARCSIECEMPGCKAPPTRMRVPRSQPAKCLIGLFP